MCVMHSQGVSPGRATISTAASSSLKLPITVSSEAACLLQLHTAATTGAAAAVAAQAAAATTASTAVSPQGLQALRPNQPFNLTWQARQDLAWEDSSALVLSYARFSDGSVMDVTDKTAVTAAAGVGGSGVLPFTLSSDNTTGLSWLTVAVTVSVTTACWQQRRGCACQVCSRCAFEGQMCRPLPSGNSSCLYLVLHTHTHNPVYRLAHLCPASSTSRAHGQSAVTLCGSAQDRVQWLSSCQTPLRLPTSAQARSASPALTTLPA